MSHSIDVSEFDPVEGLQAAVSAKRPVLTRLLERHGGQTLGEYRDGFGAQEVDDSISPREDFYQVSQDYARRLLGVEAGRDLRKRLVQSSSILTANHHGPDYLPLTVQGNVFFGVNEPSVVPVYAFGDVPLNNLTWGRGILVSRGEKVNIFPGSVQSSLVSVAAPFSRDMVEKAIKAARTSTLPERERDVVINLLQDDYLADAVLGCESYSDQAVLLNARLWKKMFADGVSSSTLTYLEMEKVVGKLLEIDFRDENSFMSQLLFNEEVRKSVMEALDGATGCWNGDRLSKMADPRMNHEERMSLLPGSGSAFFYGIDAKGRRVPFSLSMDGSDWVLSGVDNSQNVHTLPLNRDAILGALEGGRVIPTLFTSFAATAFARGLSCYGGFMQADYLTVMREGLAGAFDSVGHTSWAEKLRRVPTENYATGMQYVVRRDPAGEVRAAGTIDLISAGGLTQDQVARIRDGITVSDANTLGLPDIYNVVYRPQEIDPNLAKITTGDVYGSLGGKLVELSV